MRVVKNHIARGRLKQPKRARKFIYPVFMVYPEARDEEAYADWKGFGARPPSSAERCPARFCALRTPRAFSNRLRR